MDGAFSPKDTFSLPFIEKFLLYILVSSYFSLSYFLFLLGVVGWGTILTALSSFLSGDIVK